MYDRLLRFANALEAYAEKSAEISARLDEEIKQLEKRIALWQSTQE
jgi:hypothetical protein